MAIKPQRLRSIHVANLNHTRQRGPQDLCACPYWMAGADLSAFARERSKCASQDTTSDDLDLHTHFVWWVPARRTHGAPQHAVNSCGPFQFPLVTSDMTIWISSRMHYCEPLIEARRLALLTGPCTGRGMPHPGMPCVCRAGTRHTYKMYGQVSKHGLPKSGNHPLARHLHLRRMR